MDTLTKFNTTVKEFIRDLTQVFPDDDDFQMIQLGVTTAMFTDPSLVQSKFHEKVTIPYETYIVQRNEDFFLNNTYDDLKDTDAFATVLIDKLKIYWVKLDVHNRDMVWKYLKVLLLLDKRIQSASASA